MTQTLEKVFRPLALIAMLLLALTGGTIGIQGLEEWKNLAPGTLAYYGMSLMAGLALLVPVAVALRNPLKIRAAALGGVAGALALCFNQVVGLHFKTILCTTPS